MQVGRTVSFFAKSSQDTPSPPPMDQVTSERPPAISTIPSLQRAALGGPSALPFRAQRAQHRSRLAPPRGAQRPSDPRRTNPAPHHLQSILLSSPRGARRLLCSAPGAHRAHRARLQPLHLFHPSHPPNHLKLDPGSDSSLSYAHLNAQTSSSALLFARHRTGALSDSVGNPPKALRRHFSSFL